MKKMFSLLISIAVFLSMTGASVYAPAKAEDPPPDVTNISIESQSFSEKSESGIGHDDTGLLNAMPDSWVKYADVDFGSGQLKRFMAMVSLDKRVGGKFIEIRIDSLDGRLIGTLRSPLPEPDS